MDIVKKLVAYLTTKGFTAYATGNDTDIESKPCLIIGSTGFVKSWLPLPAKEWTVEMALVNSKQDDALEASVLFNVLNFTVPTGVDYFRIDNMTGALDGDDWVTTWTFTFITKQ